MAFTPSLSGISCLLRSFARLFFGITPDSREFTQLQAGLGILARVGDRRISIAWLPSERRTARALEDLCDLLRQQTAPDCFLAELRDEQGIPQNSLTSLTRRLTLETLRRHQVEHLYRRALEDIDWEGFRIPKGWLVRICLANSHRDPAIFDHPDDFDPERFVSEPPTQSEFLPFGAFRRSCLGDGVTHAFARQFLCTVSQWDCRQAGESHEDYHAWHWTPGSDFRIHLQPHAISTQ